jgi:mRNA interferase RelE/StbE
LLEYGYDVAVKTIVLTHSAARDLDKLSRASRIAVAQALISHAVSGKGEVSGLDGRDAYRMRVGSCRVIFAEEAATITAIFLGERANPIREKERA